MWKVWPVPTARDPQMEHLLKTKRKKSPGPPHQLISSGNHSSFHPGSSDSGSVLVTFPGGGRGSVDSFQDKMDEDQELPASEPLTHGVVTGSPGRSKVEGTGDTGEGEIDPVEISRSAKRSRRGSFLGGTNRAAETLKVTLGAIANRGGTTAVKDKVKGLLSHITSLNTLFATPPRDVAEQRRRDELIRKFESAEEQLRSLPKQLERQQLTDHAQDNEDVLGVLEDLQEAIVNYRVCSEAGDPVRLGAGSFATVYVISGGLLAFKEVAHVDDADKLRQEYDALDYIYRQCNTDSFAIPRALGFYNPLTQVFSTNAPSPLSANRVRAAGAPLVTSDMMACFQRPTYAMDRVHALPINARRYIASCPFSSQPSDGPALCRLYFGRDYTGTAPSRFVNTTNFPLDEARYTQLVTRFQFLPPATDIARAMGNMLSRLHHRASIDARDVEFVLGGDGGAGFTFFLIDFNQVRTWDSRPESIDQLVSAFFGNDPYYPRPRASDPLYNHFKTAYLSSCGEEGVGGALAIAFFDAIESFQAQRDLRRAQGG